MVSRAPAQSKFQTLKLADAVRAAKDDRTNEKIVESTALPNEVTSLNKLSLRVAGRMQVQKYNLQPPPAIPKEYICTVSNKLADHESTHIECRAPNNFTVLRRKINWSRTNDDESRIHWSTDSLTPMCPPRNKKSANYSFANYGTGPMCLNCIRVAKKHHGLSDREAEQYIKGES